MKIASAIPLLISLGPDPGKVQGTCRSFANLVHVRSFPLLVHSSGTYFVQAELSIKGLQMPLDRFTVMSFTARFCKGTPLFLGFRSCGELEWLAGRREVGRGRVVECWIRSLLPRGVVGFGRFRLRKFVWTRKRGVGERRGAESGGLLQVRRARIAEMLGYWLARIGGRYGSEGRLRRL